MDTHTKYPLDSKWDIYVHGNDNADWSINGYIKIITLENIEDFWSFFNNVPKVQGILFIMREGIQPIWETPENKKGGAFTLFFSEDNYQEYITKISSYLVSENLLLNDTFSPDVNGISITSKHNSFSLKIWIKNSKNSSSIKFKPELNMQTLNFKRHFEC